MCIHRILNPFESEGKTSLRRHHTAMGDDKLTDIGEILIVIDQIRTTPREVY